MPFNSSIFLMIFFPVCVLVNYILKGKSRNLFVIAMSFFFYAWCGIGFFALLFGSATVAYFIGLFIEKTRTEKQRKIVFVLGIAIHLLILFYYKYFVDFGNFIFKFVPDSSFTFHRIALPLGISFYTFSILSYLTDVFWKNTAAQKNILNLYLYVLFFPKVIQGPIMIYNEFESQISPDADSRKVTIDSLNTGLELFIIGMAKKVLIANNLQSIVSYSFENIMNVGTIPAWIGIIAYLLQLYYDFSGYSDMAVGVAGMLGFKIPRNFDYPYMSRTVAEYWRRWHISLGEWFKTYLYMPLMKTFAEKPWISKFSNPMLAADIFSISITWVITGVWHGSGIQFIIYGVWWAIFLIFERVRDQRRKALRKAKKMPKKDTKFQIVTDHLITIFAIIFEQVNFRANGLSTVINYWKRMLSVDFRDGFYFTTELSNSTIFALIAGIVFCFPVFKKLREGIIAKNTATTTIYRVCLFLLFVILFAFVLNSAYSPFLYQVF